VVVTSCGFKSHLPHERLKSKDLSLFALSGKLLFFLKWEFSLIQLPMWFAEYSEEFAGDVLDNSVKKCLESYSGREQRM
jgi:hypothetical protein